MSWRTQGTEHKLRDRFKIDNKQGMQHFFVFFNSKKQGDW